MAIYCYTCKKHTHTSEPVMIRRLVQDFHIYGLCAECRSTKTGPLRVPVIPKNLLGLKMYWNYMVYYDCGEEKKNLFEVLNPLINY